MSEDARSAWRRRVGRWRASAGGRRLWAGLFIGCTRMRRHNFAGGEVRVRMTVIAGEG